MRLTYADKGGSTRLRDTGWCCTQVFIVSSNKIQERNYETLYKWITRQKGNIITRIVLSVPAPWQVRPSMPYVAFAF